MLQPNANQFSKMYLFNLEVDSEDFNTLTHGDLRNSNLLHEYHPDGIANTILLDYQFCEYGSPAQDLLFLITISAAKDIRIRKFDMFVSIYLRSDRVSADLEVSERGSQPKGPTKVDVQNK